MLRLPTQRSAPITRAATHRLLAVERDSGDRGRVRAVARPRNPRDEVVSCRCGRRYARRDRWCGGGRTLVRRESIESFGYGGGKHRHRIAIEASLPLTWGGRRSISRLPTQILLSGHPGGGRRRGHVLDSRLPAELTREADLTRTVSAASREKRRDDSGEVGTRRDRIVTSGSGPRRH